MKRILLTAVMLGALSVYGQEVSRHPQYTTLGIPEVEFFHYLYRDDYIGDTLLVDGKMYFFSQSPMKQSHNYMVIRDDYYMRLKEDLKMMDFIQGPISSRKGTGKAYGIPDKGYVLHFSVGKDRKAQIDRGTFDGTLYKEDNGKPIESVMILQVMGGLVKEKYASFDYPLPVTWLNGRYRINDVQTIPGRGSNGNRYIAVFENGKLKEIFPDTEKENFNPPLVDILERPEGMPMPEFVPEYVYYKLPNGELQKEKLDVAIKKWQQKVMDTFQAEPFLDLDCVEALKQIWIKQ